MNKKSVLVALAVVAVLGGCIPVSLNPFYGEKNLTFDPALVGLWGESGDDTQISFQQSGKDSYCMIDLKTDSTLKFDIHLFTLGGKQFLDLYPESTGAAKNDLLDMHLIRAHSLVRVDQITPTLITAALNVEWLKDLLSKDPKALRHVIHNDQIVLTASTAEIQAFLLKHLDAKDAFETPSEMTRIQPK